MTQTFLFGDEAGNTGPTLLDAAQPVFTYAITDLSREEAADVLATLKVNATEAHSTSLFRRKNVIERLEPFFAHPAIGPDRVSVYVIHKKHMLVSKIIDLLVESLAYRDGVDLYEDGANIAMANLATQLIESFLDHRQQQHLLGGFVQMLKAPSPDTVDKFYQSVHQTLHELPINCRPVFDIFMLPIVLSEEIIFDVLRHNDKFTLDPIVPSLFSLAYHWGKKYPEGFILRTDEAKTLARKQEDLEMFMAEHLEGVAVGYDRRRHPARLPIRKIEFCASESEPSIQIADIVAGVVMRYGAPFAGLTGGRERSDQLAQFEPDRFMAGNVWPTADITPDQLGTKYEGGIHPVNAYPDLLRSKTHCS